MPSSTIRIKKGDILDSPEQLKPVKFAFVERNSQPGVHLRFVFCTIVSLTIFILASCAHPQKGESLPKPISNALYDVRPALLGDTEPYPDSLSQLVTFHYDTRTEALPFVISLSSDEILMSAIASWGSPLFVLRYDGHDITFLQAPIVDIALKPEYILGDFFLTYWPTNSLANALKPLGFTIADDGLTRQVWQDGLLVMTIQYQHNSRWRSAVELVHHQLNYQLNIQPLSESDEHGQ
ncbi:DUF3261 domain-containing protein [Corallincola luteus]|uniref:DUF3261 domain-containing protein n=1 Tax=Corallincola luteus TaxID=1775177 RepID=A0ABY2AKF8_9GAMM|nr:DUF3261 domain-containing protein [Corallincola luteus]